MNNNINLSRKEQLLQELAGATDSPAPRIPEQSDPALDRLNQLGTSLWLDTGNLEEASKLWRKEMSALTTNNTLANQVVQTGIMDDLISKTVKSVREIEPSITADDLVMDIVFVVNCHIAMRLVRAFDALVSVELHPGVSHDIEKTLRYAQRYQAVNTSHFIVKIPLTPEGYCAVARARAEGIRINYTLGFSARQNYLAAALSHPNYVNIFLGRLNQVVEENKLGNGEYVGEKTTLASQAAIKEAGATPAYPRSQQIAASMRSGDQMVSLAGVDVFTIPPKAVSEFFAQGHKPQDIRSRLDETYEVTLNPAADKSSVELLWTVDDQFKQLTRQLVSRGGTSLTGDDIRAADRDCGTKLFGNITGPELSEIRAKGKIPEIARWKGRASLDDLMTLSALQSFGKDQDAFDDHIRSIIAKS